MHITVGKYTLRQARGEMNFLSNISESANGQLKAQFYTTNRKNAVTMIESQAHDLCARLRSQDVNCFVVLASTLMKTTNKTTSI